jgi:hypothetical protein
MEMEKGVAYCGLACAVCSENTNCAGCRNDGCKEKEWCKNFQCCKAKKLEGCWVCGEFPCDSDMFKKLRVRTFAKFVKQYSVDTLLECLERNEKSGVVYHYPGKLTGDYDIPDTESDIIDMILRK